MAASIQAGPGAPAPSAYFTYMILYQNAFMKLDYDPAADILFVEWPDFRPYTLNSVKEVLRILVETVRDYDIKKLLADSSKTIIEVDEADYRAVMEEFALAIRATRVQKIARIETADPLRENIVPGLREKVEPSVVYKSFTNRDAALEWLNKETKARG